MIRNMQVSDIPAGLSLCRSAKWNQLARDWEVFITLAPDGNSVCVNERGDVLGTVPGGSTVILTVSGACATSNGI